jgi:uncharacterized protein (DUF1501 family)
MATHAHLTPTRPGESTLVVVFLRGGADGLTLVPPVQDDHYHRFRPRLAVEAADAMPLSGPFGLHPDLRALEAAWKEGDLAVVQGVGGESDTRSHFEAQDLMEHGGVAAGGWLARFLRARGSLNKPLSAVALGSAVPELLSGAPSVAAFENADEFSLGLPLDDPFTRELRALYAAEAGPLRGAAADTFEALGKIATIAEQKDDTKASYERDDFAQGLRQIARLIKADVGLDAATIDLGGWDTHFTQGTLIGPLMRRLAQGLAAFRQDLGARMKVTTVIVLTEFGRRLAENSSFGTDHGRASSMFVLGGGVKGGRMLGQWSALTPELLEGPGDVPVWNNYRDVLAPALVRHGVPASRLAEVFPDFALRPFDLYG